MDYHSRHISVDDVMQTPGDGSTFRYNEEIWPICKEEPRNVILSLAVDGVNPFGDIITNYSVWPVFVINNNLHPSMTVKREHIMFALIVPRTYI